MNFRQTDQLQKHIDWENIMKMPRYAGGHDEQMRGLFRNCKVIGHWNEGGYQGMVATCVQLLDKTYVIYNDYYGSCSGCDSWEGANDESVKRLCINLANSAYLFQNLEDVKSFLKSDYSKNEWNSWSNVKESLLAAIEKEEDGTR